MKAKEVFPGVFSRHARAYRARVMGDLDPSIPSARMAAIDAVAPRPGETALDLACGPGTLTLPLAEAVGPDGRVVAVDLAQGMLDLLAETAPPNVETRLMDIEALDFPDASFDVVTCGHGYQFVTDLDRALREARRVLRPGGRFAASLPDGGASAGVRSLMDQALGEVLPPAPRVADREATMAVIRDPDRLAAAAEAAGFRDVEVTLIEEESEHPDAETLTDRTFGWWDCAWRLEQLDPAEQARVRAHYLEIVRSVVTEWPLRTRHHSHVVFGRA